MKEITIEKIHISEMDEVACLLADTFETNPAYAGIFQNKSSLKEGLLWLFKANLIINNHKQVLTRVIKEKNTGKIIGTLTLIAPGGAKSGFSAYLKTGLAGFILKFGINTFIRMLRLDNQNKTSLKKAMKTPKYYYLSMVAVREESRGAGIGSYAVKRIIEELVSSKPECNFMGLTTQLPENVIFYSKLGFKKLDEGYAGLKDGKYYNCNMKLNLY